MNRGAAAANMMMLYAAVMVAAGAVAYALAPAGASAVTALAVPAACGGLMVVCALLSRQIDKRRVLGMIGIHMGLVLPLLFAGVIGFRASKTGDAVVAYQDAEQAFESRPMAVATGTADEAAARSEFFAARNAPEHDKTYLRNTLWFLAIASVIAFVLILSRRPKKEERV